MQGMCLWEGAKIGWGAARVLNFFFFFFNTQIEEVKAQTSEQVADVYDFPLS